jgi:DNA-binding NarL/FixJ family response regulator
MEYGETISVSMGHRDAIVRAGLGALLRTCASISVQEIGIQVVVTDYDDGLARAQRNAGLPGAAAVLVVTQRAREWDVRSALAAGVQGYVLQSCSADQLKMAVELLAWGQRYVAPELNRYVAERSTRTSLTGRETDVLQLLAQGCCNKTIARELGIGVGTVKTHVRGVFDKLGATARTHAVALANQRGMLRDGVRAG